MPNILPTILERWTGGSAASTDIFSRLLQERIIFFGGDGGAVTTDSANLLISQLLYLDSPGPREGHPPLHQLPPAAW